MYKIQIVNFHYRVNKKHAVGVGDWIFVVGDSVLFFHDTLYSSAKNEAIDFALENNKHKIVLLPKTKTQ